MRFDQRRKAAMLKNKILFMVGGTCLFNNVVLGWFVNAANRSESL